MPAGLQRLKIADDLRREGIEPDLVDLPALVDPVLSFGENRRNVMLHVRGGSGPLSRIVRAERAESRAESRATVRRMKYKPGSIVNTANGRRARVLKNGMLRFLASKTNGKANEVAGGRASAAPVTIKKVKNVTKNQKKNSGGSGRKHAKTVAMGLALPAVSIAFHTVFGREGAYFGVWDYIKENRVKDALLTLPNNFAVEAFGVNPEIAGQWQGTPVIRTEHFVKNLQLAGLGILAHKGYQKFGLNRPFKQLGIPLAV